MPFLTRSSAVVLAAISIAVLAACGGDDSPDGPSAGAAPAQAVKKPAKKPSRLVIRIWSGDQQKLYAKTAAAEFTKATGVPIKWDTTDEAVSHAKLNQQISRGDRPSADASFNAQQRAFTNAARGWTIPIDPSLVPNLAKATPEVARPSSSPTGQPPYVIPYTLSVPFIVRKDKIDPAEVASWDDLFKPALKRSLVVDSLYSSTAFGFAASMGIDPAADAPAGMDPVWKRVSELKPNLAQLGSNSDVVTALTEGSVKVAISNTGSGIAAQAAGAPIEMVAPSNGLYVVGDAYYIHKGIPAENAYYAQVFADYILDAGVQSAVANKIGFVPVNPAATVPKFMEDNPRVFPRSAADLKAVKAILAPIELMARNDTPWQKSFDNAVR